MDATRSNNILRAAIMALAGCMVHGRMSGRGAERNDGECERTYSNTNAEAADGA